jgi:hypothetical protein
VVQASTEGSRERSDSSWRKCGNAPRRDAYPNTDDEGDEHDDRDDYWSGASLQGAFGDVPDVGLAQCMLGGREFDSTKDEEPHSRKSPAESMEVVGEELDGQQATPTAEAHVLALERKSSQGIVERVVAASILPPIVGL